MIKGNLATAALLFVFGMMVTIGSYIYGVGKLSSPDAGTFPVGLGVILMILAAILFFDSISKLKRCGGADIPVWSGVNLTKTSMIIVSLLLYALLLEPLGFLACAFLIQLLLFKVAGDQRWLVAVLETILTLVVVYCVFFWGLGVYVPLFPSWIY